MGRIQALTDAQVEGIDRRFDLAGLYEDARRMENNERAVILMLKVMLAFGDLADALQVPKIAGGRFEFPVQGGRIDLLLFHADGGVTIVEAKPETEVRMIVGGIGQLCMYSVLLPAALHASRRPAYIRRVLCAPLAPEKSVDMIAACRLAGVDFVPLPSFALFKELIEAVRLTPE